jgi:TolB-like protein
MLRPSHFVSSLLLILDFQIFAQGAQKDVEAIAPKGENVLAGSASKYKRRVFLLPFMNERRDKNSEYLAVSIPEAFSTPLLKTNNFVILNRTSVERYAQQMGIYLTDLYDVKNAVNVGKKVGADVVVVGKFESNEKGLKINARAIDVQAEALSVEDSESTAKNTAMFDAISRLAERMSRPMAEKMKPMESAPPVAEANLPQKKQEAISGLSEPDKGYHSNFYFGLGAPLGTIAEHTGLNMGIRGSVWRNFRYKYLNPVVILEGVFATGKTVESMLFYYTGIGLSHAFAVRDRFSLQPLFSFGLAGGRLNSGSGSGFFMPALEFGAVAEYELTREWRIAASTTYKYLFDKFVPGAFWQFYLGAGFRF